MAGVFIPRNMEKITGIYKITSPIGRIYIGQSTNCCKRKYRYSVCDCKGQPRIYRSIKKHGWDAHKFEVIHQCLPYELNALEIHYIELYQCFDNENGLNLQSGGNRPIFSIETREKMRCRMKGTKLRAGKTHREESINKMKSSHKLNPTRYWLNKNLTEQHIEKMKRAKQLDAPNMSEKMKGNTNGNKQICMTNAKGVKMVFLSVIIASKYIGIRPNQLSAFLKGKGKLPKRVSNWKTGIYL